METCTTSCLSLEPRKERMEVEKKVECSLCGGTGEIVQRPQRLMGYTIAVPNESVDEKLIPCPLCQPTLKLESERL